MAEIKAPAIGTDGAFFGKGLEAAQRVHHGHSVNVCSPEFAGGADPTGAQDSTAAFQAAVDKINSLGGGTVIIPAGEFRVSPPFVALKGYTTIRGEGTGSTRIFVDNSKVTESTEETGVFHTGSYNAPVADPGLFRVTISDLSILTTAKSGEILRTSEGAYRHIPKSDFNNKIWGIVFHTYLLPGPAEPDAVHTLHDLEIWDTAGGIAMLGLDDQGSKLADIRIRRTWKQGLLIGKPADHPAAYETNPDTGKPTRKGGAADNKFTRMDVSSANIGLEGYAGIEINTSQCMFHQCTSWYHKRGATGAYTGSTLPTGAERNIWNFKANQETIVAGQANPTADPFRFLKDGAGWYVNGRDNEFSNCTSQETDGHGWVLAGNSCTFNHCRGESPSFKDNNTPGVTGPMQAAGFVITNWAWGNDLNGCIVKNAYAQTSGAKVAFAVQAWAADFSIRACRAYKMPFTNGVDATDGEEIISLPKDLGAGVKIEINDFVYPAAGSAASGGAASAPALIPSEIGSVTAHWDFSDSSTITAEAGRVSEARLVAGSAPDGTLAQATETQRPWLSSLAGRTAIKVKRAETDFLQAADMGTAPAASGWSVAMVAALASNIKGQYLFSSIYGGKFPASITTGDRLSLRGNSGGSSAGWTRPTADGAATLYTPAVIVMTANSDGVQMYVDGKKSAADPIVSTAIADLKGKATIGAYYGATDGADASIGEVAIFGKALSDEEVAGLSAHLQSKWS